MFSVTEVRDITPVRNLHKLREIHATGSCLNDISPLTDLKNLQKVYLAYSMVKDLNPLKELISNRLDVKWKGELKSKGIYVQEIPLTNPPIEIAKQGNAAILRYWEEQERSGLKQLNEARLLIVGQGGAGKTTLKEKLKNPNAAMPEPDMTTRGIVIEFLNFKDREGVDFTLHIWDFWRTKHSALRASVFYVRLGGLCVAVE